MSENINFIIRPRAMLLGKPVFHVLAQVEETTPKLIAVCPWMEDAVRVAEALAVAENGQVVSELEEQLETAGMETQPDETEPFSQETRDLEGEEEVEIPSIEEEILPDEMLEVTHEDEQPPTQQG